MLVFGRRTLEANPWLPNGIQIILKDRYLQVAVSLRSMGSLVKRGEVLAPGARSSVFAPSSDARSPSSFLFLVVRPGAPTSVLVPFAEKCMNMDGHLSVHFQHPINI